jgi:hypothetical protein
MIGKASYRHIQGNTYNLDTNIYLQMCYADHISYII